MTQATSTSSEFPKPYTEQLRIATIALRDGVFRPSTVPERMVALRMCDRGMMQRNHLEPSPYSYTLKEMDKWPEPLKTLLEAHRAAVTAES